VRIETPRLVADRLTDADEAGLARIAGDPRVAPMLGSFPSPCPPAKAREVIARSQDLSRPGFRLALRHAGAFAGTLGLSPVAEDGASMISYFLDPPLWGRGLMTEALSAFLPALDAAFALPVIEATAFEDNPASIRILRRTGFRIAGSLTEPSAARQGTWPSLLMRRVGPG
jgi:RimJ/RimL family protein N-acetyltransferase